MENGSPDRLEVPRVTPGQIMQIWLEAAAHSDEIRHDAGHRFMHPRRIDRAIVVPRMDGEPRHEDSLLDPADEQLGVRRRPGEAADVMAAVGHAAERQT